MLRDRPRETPSASPHEAGSGYQGSTTTNRDLQSYDEDDSLRLKRAIEALDLLEGCHARYLESSPPNRKNMNNALLAPILISPIAEEIHVELRLEIAEPLSIEDVNTPFA